MSGYRLWGSWPEFKSRIDRMVEDMPILPNNHLYEFKLFVTRVSTCSVDTICEMQGPGSVW